MKKIRVLHVITNFSGRGGAERMLSRLIKSTPSVEHHLISLMHFSDVYNDSLVQCKSSYALGWNLKSTPKVLYQLARHITSIQPDVIQCWMYHANVFGVVAALFSGMQKKVIWGVRHSLDSYEDESISTRVALKLGCMLSNLPGASIYCSRLAIKQHGEFGYASRSDLYVPNGIDLAAYQPSRKATVHNEHALTVGVVARFHEAKGYEYLLKAIFLVHKTRKDILFKLAGRGVSDKNSDFMALVDANNLDIEKIQLCGDLDDVSPLYQSIDLLVQSSITEGFPNVLVEAMASGVPCVATDVGDSREIVGDTGFIVPSRSPEALAKAILDYSLMSHVQHMEYGESARNRVMLNFDISIVANKYISIWHGVSASAQG